MVKNLNFGFVQNNITICVMKNIYLNLRRLSNMLLDKIVYMSEGQ